MGKIKPLTVREQYLAKRIGISDSVYSYVSSWSQKTLNGNWQSQRRPRLPSEYRNILRRRANNPSYKPFKEILTRFKKGFDTINELNAFYWEVHRHDKYQGYLVRKFVEAEDEIEGLSDRQIMAKMLLKGDEK